jgi:hypothetical protein
VSKGGVFTELVRSAEGGVVPAAPDELPLVPGGEFAPVGLPAAPSELAAASSGFFETVVQTN